MNTNKLKNQVFNETKLIYNSLRTHAIDITTWSQVEPRPLQRYRRLNRCDGLQCGFAVLYLTEFGDVEDTRLIRLIRTGATTVYGSANFKYYTRYRNT